MAYTAESIKNVAIAGHGGTGKTTLFEHMLFAGGAIPRPETVESGRTVSDYSPEEIERKISIHAAMAHVERKGKKINFFDTPGSSDFIGDVILTFRASEFALLCVDGSSGVQIETIKLWRNLQQRKKPCGIMVTKMDSERADFDAVMRDVKEKLKITPVPATLPIGKGANFTGVVDILNDKALISSGAASAAKEEPIPDDMKEASKAARERLIEAAADGDDTLMGKYIEQGTLSGPDMHKGLIEALGACTFVPAFCSSAVENVGLLPFLDFIADAGPEPRFAKDVAVDAEGKQYAVPLGPDKPLAAMVIKTTYDQFSGKLSWIKVMCGKLSADMDIHNVTENKKERVGKLYTCVGKKLEEIPELCTGDIGIITKSATLKTSDTITGGTSSAEDESALRFLPLRLPEPVLSIAVNAVEKKNDDKLGDALVRASEEDRTFKYSYNPETKETVISGMGELQVNIILDKIKANQKIAVETHIPRVAYRETITKKVGPVEYTHKKQTGGHGQYAKVVIEIAPLARGGNYQFDNKIFGGHISKGYIPGIEKGIAEGMARGVMAQYPVVDVEVGLLDGKEHPVDSNELSFKLAARNAFREAMRQAAPVLLEPIMALTVWVEDSYQGAIMSDISGKRGRVISQDEAGGIAEIKAEVPQAELQRYSIDLRAMTSGTGSFEVAFDHYAPITGRIADDVIKAAEAYKVEEKDE
jgi:elongation factor G